MKRQVSGSLSCFKTKDSRHSKIKYTYIIYIITSFINSETTALLHLTSFTEEVTNSGFNMPIWEIFSKFLRLCNLFHEWNNSKIWETRKIFANIVEPIVNVEGRLVIFSYFYFYCIWKQPLEFPLRKKCFCR